MFDSIDISQLPAGAPAYAGYVNGRWPTFALLLQKFPRAHLLDIAVNSGADATCLDVETGDATNADIYTWFVRQQARKVWRPVVYTSVSNADALVAVMTANGFNRAEYRLWSAHYSGEHICGPATCKLTRFPCDGTQWTDKALGRNLDQSVLSDTFFGAPPAPAPIREPIMDRITATRPDSGTDIYVLLQSGAAVHVQKDATGKTVNRDTPPGTWAGWRTEGGVSVAYMEGIGTDGGDWEDTWHAPETGWQQPVKLA
jgi:hypothetical protein